MSNICQVFEFSIYAAVTVHPYRYSNLGYGYTHTLNDTSLCLPNSGLWVYEGRDIAGTDLTNSRVINRRSVFKKLTEIPSITSILLKKSI